MSERYVRQTMMPQIGKEGQLRLSRSRVLVVGAGGLGSPVLLYLAAAGVGTIGIADGDTVSQSNLNRQVLYGPHDIGASKAEVARRVLLEKRPDLLVHTYSVQNEASLASIAGEYDAVVDCVDALHTRLWVQRACLHAGVPVVEAGIESWGGYVMSVRPLSACLGCLMGERTLQGALKTRETPVLGATAGVAGSLQAAECIKILLGAGQPLFDQALYFDLLGGQFITAEVERHASCPICSDL